MSPETYKDIKEWNIDRNILLLGNAYTVLDYELGHEIDGFDTVVRFNNFQWDDPAKIGTKFDIHARRACDDVQLLPADSFKEVVCFVTWCPLTQGMKRVARNVQAYYGSQCTIVDENICRSIGEDIGLDHPKERASVGALAIGYYLSKYPHIWLHGFTSKDYNKHYFNKPPKDAHFHNWDKERVWIAQLSRDKRIFFLSP